MRDKQGQQRRWRADGRRSGPCFLVRVRGDAADGRAPPTARCSKAFCGFCAAALAGRICPKSSPRRPRAGADCATGKSKVSGSISGGRFWPNSTNGNSCSGASLFWTGVLLPPKRGAGVGKTKRGKGTKWMGVVGGRGLPLGKNLGAASPPEAR